MKKMANNEHGTNLAEVGTDCISRQAAIDATWKDTGYTDPFNVMTAIRDRIKQLPPIQPEPSEECERCMMEHMDNMEKLEVELAQAKMQLPPIQPEIVRCKDCKYFEYDHIENVNGIPLIVAHEICTRWGDGVKTSENGYCFLAERRQHE